MGSLPFGVSFGSTAVLKSHFRGFLSCHDKKNIYIYKNDSVQLGIYFLLTCQFITVSLFGLIKALRVAAC